MRGPLSLLLILVALSARPQADSLWRVWSDAGTPDSARLQAIQQLAWKTVFEQPDSGVALAWKQLEVATRARSARSIYEAHTTIAVGSSMRGDHAAALEHLSQCMALAKAMGDLKRQSSTYRNQSNVYRSIGDLPLALEQLQRSLRIDTELGNSEGLEGTYNNIGNLYTELGEPDKALENYRRSAELADALNSDKGRAQAAMNLGSTLLDLGRPDTAIILLRHSLERYRKLGRKPEQGMVLNNLGRAYGLLGRMPEAFASLDSAERILSALGAAKPLARTHVNRGTLLLKAGRAVEAVTACRAGERIALEANLLQQRRECLSCLHQAYERLGDYRKAYAAQAEYTAVHDSLQRINNSKEVTRLEVSRSFQERMLADSLSNVRQRYEDQLAYQQQLGREREQRNIFLFSGIGVLLLAGGLWNRLRYTRRSRAAIQREKDRSDGLLHNILPEEVAAELKAKGHAEARHFDQVTILFTDFKGFTGVSERLSPAELVEELNCCFTAFDAIMERYSVEKIKTIGDAYMAAGGVPEPRRDAAADVIRAALDMQAFMLERYEARTAQGLPAFQMRAGVHTGAVVAGIVGSRKFQYDIWGDAVNTAARMESSGEAGRVNISGATHALAMDAPDLAFIPRGRVSAKGKGELEMWFAERPRG